MPLSFEATLRTSAMCLSVLSLAGSLCGPGGVSGCRGRCPAHLQVPGYILHGHEAGQCQHVLLEGVSVAATRIREAEFDLGGLAAVEAAEGPGIMLDAEADAAFLESGADQAVAADAPGVVQPTGGHAFGSFLKPCNSRKDRQVRSSSMTTHAKSGRACFQIPFPCDQFHFGGWRDDPKGQWGIKNPQIGWLGRRDATKAGMHPCGRQPHESLEAGERRASA